MVEETQARTKSLGILISIWRGGSRYQYVRANAEITTPNPSITTYRADWLPEWNSVKVADTGSPFEIVLKSELVKTISVATDVMNPHVDWCVHIVDPSDQRRPSGSAHFVHPVTRFSFQVIL
jgi:hypothetical protein